MKILLATLLITSAFAAQATELLRMKDGTSASCKTKYDVTYSKVNNVYSFSNPEMEESEDSVAFALDVNFYECTENNGKFSFKKLDNHMTATYTYPDFENGGTITANRIDKNKYIVAYNDKFEVIAKGEIQKDDGQYYVILTLDKSDIEANNFPQAQEKGAFFSTVALRVQTKVVTPTIDHGYTLKMNGAFRLFFDLNK